MTPDIVRLEEQLNACLVPYEGARKPRCEWTAAADRWAQVVWDVAMACEPYAVNDAVREQAAVLAGQAVFVCGTHRSGTTLMRNLLDGHPRLSVLPSEGTFFPAWHDKLLSHPEGQRMGRLCHEWLRRLANPVNQAPFWILGRSDLHQSPYIDFVRRMDFWWDAVQAYPGSGTVYPLVALALAYASCMPGEFAGLSRWVEKTPELEFHFESVWAHLPSARIIQMVRHPLAVYASRKALEEEGTPGFAARRHVLRSLKWSFEIAVHCSTRPFPYLLVRYEDLLAQPEATMSRVAAFLDIEMSPVLLTPAVAGRRVAANSSFAAGTPPGVILDTDMEARVDTLSPGERELVAACVGGVARKLGYEIERCGTVRRWRARAALLLSDVRRKLSAHA